MNPGWVIGIDPGSRRTGWGVIYEKSGVLELVDCGVIRTERACGAGLPDSGSSGFARRLAEIFRGLEDVLKRRAPEEAAVEQVFTAKSAASALKLGQARGAAVAACAAAGIEVFDYEPNLIKKSLVGAGRAEKEQVSFMVGRLLNIKSAGLPLDATDALAAAICHLSQRRLLGLAARARQGF